MDDKIQAEFRRAVASGVNRPLLSYIQARLNDVKDQLTISGDAGFKQLQGRAQELSDLIKELERAREP